MSEEVTLVSVGSARLQVTRFSHAHSLQHFVPLQPGNATLIQALRAVKGKAIPLQEVKAPKFQDNRQGYQPYAPAAFTPQEIFLVLISVRG